jgi:rubrerythrin
MSNPRKPNDMGTNRTGIGTSPIDSKDIIREARKATDQPRVDGRDLLKERLALSRQVAPVGSMPPPASMKGVAKSAIDAVKGKHPTVFLDLLGERLAFERTGTRLYDALLAKYDAADPAPTGPSRTELEQMREEELEHFALLKKAMETLGADPTAITPSADITAVMSMGLVQTLTDPRVTLTEALKAILLAELADNDGWLVLADVAERLGHTDLASEFQRALAEEEEHLARVRSWVTSAIEGQAGLEPVTEATIGGDGGDVRR